jgi:hypothetical protein
MIDFLYRLSKALREESNLFISAKKKKGIIQIKVFDYKKKGIMDAKVYANNEFIGFTNAKGFIELKAGNAKKLSLKAEIGIYFTKKDLIF